MALRKKLLKRISALIGVLVCLLAVMSPALAMSFIEDTENRDGYYNVNMLYLDTLDYLVYNSDLDESCWLSFDFPGIYLSSGSANNVDCKAGTYFIGRDANAAYYYQIYDNLNWYHTFDSLYNGTGLIGLNAIGMPTESSWHKMVLRSSQNFVLNYGMLLDFYQRAYVDLPHGATLSVSISFDLLFPVYNAENNCYDWEEHSYSYELPSVSNTSGYWSEVRILSHPLNLINDGMYNALHDGFVICTSFNIAIDYMMLASNMDETVNANDLSQLHLAMPYMHVDVLPSTEEVLAKYAVESEKIVYVEVDTDMSNFGSSILSVATSFLDFELAPGFSLSGLLGILAGIVIVFLLLKLFGGS